MQIRADSTEYATATLTTDHDLSLTTVEVACPVTGSPPVTYVVAEVLGSVDQGNGKFVTTYRVLLGPAGQTTLPVGTYDWIVKITDTPEVPVRKAGTITVV